MVKTRFPFLGEQDENQVTSDGEIVASKDGYQVIDILHFDNEDTNIAVVTITSETSGDVIWEFDVNQAAASEDESITFNFPNGLHSNKGEAINIAVTGSTSWKCSILYYDNQ